MIGKLGYRSRSIAYAALLVSQTAAGASPGSAPLPLFEDVTTPVVGIRALCVAMNWIDFDLDGRPDIYVTTSDANWLFRNTGADTFAVAPSIPGSETARSFGGAWGDVDLDGDRDVYVANEGPQDWYFTNDSGVFTDTGCPEAGGNNPGRDAAWGDFDRDADLDLLLANVFGENYLLRNEDPHLACPLTDVTDSLAPAFSPTTQSSLVRWCHCDADLEMDFYLSNFGGPNRLFRQVGGLFENVADSHPINGNGGLCFGFAWGDYDNDGDFDVYIGRRTENILAANNGDCTFFDATSDSLGTRLQTNATEWGDYDNDGDLDLCLANEGGHRLFRNDGGDSFSDVTDSLIAGGGIGAGFGWCDYDGDGDLDLYLTQNYQGSGPGNRLLRNLVGADNAWLEIDLAGIQSNTFGVGARIWVTAGSLRQVRMVGGGGGNCLTAHFGLGQAPVADTVRVRWPNGMEDVLVAVPARQRITVVEGSTAAASDSIEDPRTSDLTVSPNPSGSGFDIRLHVDASGPVELRVFDATGRQVWMNRLRCGPQTGVLRWHSRDTADRPVPPGRYFVRVRTLRMTMASSVLVLP